ncbi:mgtA regulatory leader peptide MgtL [Salmonella enterica subsp. enterica serovar Derby]|nr:mgtA regulatory leader peptide MgtL [Citrobacter freundii]MBJ3557947.1 mgtA regulatory leader peptide MgtL [Salmonella enterica subsp. enterica serovar Derby]MBJ4955295.1 mgtA regulatory leader peptide MgtL [Salmonella enterica subsp. enterica serovar Goldcoast]
MQWAKSALNRSPFRRCVYVWFSFCAVSYRHNCHKPYGFLRIIRSANLSLTGGYMDPDPTPLPRRRNNSFR